MKYYKYIRTSDVDLTYRIHKAVQDCKPLALAKYRSNWEDALDDAYFHILEHYDESQGSLEHYAMRIVNTIYMNKYSREVGSETVYDIESTKYAMEKDEETNPFNNIALEEEDIEYSTELKRCIRYLLPYFIKDYELFYSKDGSTRKMNYKGLLDMFPAKMILEAMDVLVQGYYEEAKYLANLSKNCHVRNFDADRYKNSMDKTLSYVGKIGDIIKCKSISKRRKKYAYVLDIEDFLEKLYEMFFSDEGIASRVIYEDIVYCSFSGQLVCDKRELLGLLEKELIGSLLSLRTNFKVLNYVRGKELILSSTSGDEPVVILSLFKTGIYVPLTRMIIGRVDN